MLTIVFLTAALVLFVIAATTPRTWPGRGNLIAAGLACWVASQLASHL